jgi:hypothetical protein
MSEFLFVVDPNTHELTKARSVSLADIGTEERSDRDQYA